MQSIETFIAKHKLPISYSSLIDDWFSPLAAQIAIYKQGLRETLVVGINGAQGSGKSTLADLFVQLFSHEFGLKAVALSLDDFYYTHQEREQLSESIHPLLQTRGVPGTHDVGFAIDVMQRLSSNSNSCSVPRFNKSTDDRCSQDGWQQVLGQVDIIILDGWCLGAEAQAANELVKPVNYLEEVEDQDSSWRTYVNTQLSDLYPTLFSYIDIWIMLKAPSFDCIYQWRLEQEHKLRQQRENSDKAITLMTDEELARFTMFFQRITEQQLISLPEKVDYLFELNEQREIQQLVYNKR